LGNNGPKTENMSNSRYQISNVLERAVNSLAGIATSQGVGHFYHTDVGEPKLYMFMLLDNINFIKVLSYKAEFMQKYRREVLD